MCCPLKSRSSTTDLPIPVLESTTKNVVIQPQKPENQTTVVEDLVEQVAKTILAHQEALALKKWDIYSFFLPKILLRRISKSFFNQDLIPKISNDKLDTLSSTFFKHFQIEQLKKLVERVNVLTSQQLREYINIIEESWLVNFSRRLNSKQINALNLDNLKRLLPGNLEDPRVKNAFIQKAKKEGIPINVDIEKEKKALKELANSPVTVSKKNYSYKQESITLCEQFAIDIPRARYKIGRRVVSLPAKPVEINAYRAHKHLNKLCEDDIALSLAIQSILHQGLIASHELTLFETVFVTDTIHSQQSKVAYSVKFKGTHCILKNRYKCDILFGLEPPKKIGSAACKSIITIPKSDLANKDFTNAHIQMKYKFNWKTT